MSRCITPPPPTHAGATLLSPCVGKDTGAVGRSRTTAAVSSATPRGRFPSRSILVSWLYNIDEEHVLQQAYAGKEKGRRAYGPGLVFVAAATAVPRARGTSQNGG